MINISKYKSLHLIVGSIIVLTVSCVMFAIVNINHNNLNKSLHNDFYKDSDKTFNRLKQSIKPFINSYSINEYINLITNEMKDESIVAIVLEDFVTAKVLSKKSYFVGKKRDKYWNLVDIDDQQKDIKNYFLKKEDEIVSNKVPIGKLTIYYTDKFLNEKVDSFFKHFYIVYGSLSLLLVAVLYFTLNKFVVNPIYRLVNTLEQITDRKDLYNKIDTQSGSREIVKLSKTLKEMLNKIELLSNRYKLTLDAVQDGVWDWDIKSNNVYYSTNWITMLGYEKSEIKPELESFFNLIHKNDKEKVKKSLEKHFNDPLNNFFNEELRLKCKDGSYKWILSRGKAIFDKHQNLVRMLGSHTDISLDKINEQKQKEQEQLYYEQAKMAALGEMIGNIAHQWRQPLNTVSLITTSVKLESDFDTLSKDKVNDYTNRIFKNIKYLSGTIDTFRNFIKQGNKKENISVNQLLDDSLEIIKDSLNNNHIKLYKEYENIDEKVFVSPSEFTQVMINIVNNAQDALLENNIDDPYIKVKAYIKDQRVFIITQDNGGGIKDEIINKLFEPYTTTKHQSQGTGLGLNMSYKIITESFNGKLYAKNIQNGAGFFIELSLV